MAHKAGKQRSRREEASVFQVTFSRTRKQTSEWTARRIKRYSEFLLQDLALEDVAVTFSRTDSLHVP